MFPHPSVMRPSLWIHAYIGARIIRLNPGQLAVLIIAFWCGGQRDPSCLFIYKTKIKHICNVNQMLSSYNSWAKHTLSLMDTHKILIFRTHQQDFVVSFTGIWSVCSCWLNLKCVSTYPRDFKMSPVRSDHLLYSVCNDVSQREIFTANHGEPPKKTAFIFIGISSASATIAHVKL